MRTLTMLSLLALAATAQDLTRKAPPQKGPVAIVNATIHTLAGDPIENGYVLFENGKVVDIGKVGKSFPATVRIVYAADKHVYPGLIAPHTNLGLTEIGAVRASRDFAEVGRVTPEVRAAVAINPDSTLIPVARSNGVLSFAAFPRGGALPGRASVMRADGWTWEDMAIDADAGLVVTWPRGRPPHRPFAERSGGDLEKAIRENHRRIDDAFRDAKAYFGARAGNDETPVDIRFEAMRPAVEGGKPVFFLADDYDQIVAALAFAKRHALKAVIVGGQDAWQCTDRIKAQDAAVIVTSIHRFPKRADSDYDETYRLPARLEAAGVRWCLGSGEGASNERNLPYAAGRAVAYGLPRDAAIRSITKYAADVLGVGDRLGTLEKDKAATFLVADGDPLQIATKVEMAFIDGRRVDLSNKQSQLYAKYRAKYRDLGLIPDTKEK